MAEVAADPLEVIAAEFERGAEVLSRQRPILGCPLNNLAQEMNPWMTASGPGRQRFSTPGGQHSGPPWIAAARPASSAATSTPRARRTR